MSHQRVTLDYVLCFLCWLMWWDISAVTVDSLTITGIPCQAWARQVGSRTTYSKKSVRFGPKEGFLRGKMGYCGKEEGSWSGGPRRETKGIADQQEGK